MSHRSEPINADTEPVREFRPSIYGLLIQSEGILLVRAPPALFGVVGFPGGGIEPGEAPLDALRREFVEETGLEVEPVRLLWATTGFHRSQVNPHRQLLGIYWEVRGVGGHLRPAGNGDDVEAAFFCPVDTLPLSEMLEFDREVVHLLSAR
ncbi:MAG: NUDIX domain-containing protein [Candidatus Entotheonellia bacterium]